MSPRRQPVACRRQCAALGGLIFDRWEITVVRRRPVRGSGAFWSNGEDMVEEAVEEGGRGPYATDVLPAGQPSSPSCSERPAKRTVWSRETRVHGRVLWLLDRGRAAGRRHRLVAGLRAAVTVRACAPLSACPPLRPGPVRRRGGSCQGGPLWRVCSSGRVAATVVVAAAGREGGRRAGRTQERGRSPDPRCTRRPDGV